MNCMENGHGWTIHRIKHKPLDINTLECNEWWLTKLWWILLTWTSEQQPWPRQCMALEICVDDTRLRWITLGLSMDECAMRLDEPMDIPLTNHAPYMTRWNEHKQTMNKLWARSEEMTRWHAKDLNLNQRSWINGLRPGLGQASDTPYGMMMNQWSGVRGTHKE